MVDPVHDLQVRTMTLLLYSIAAGALLWLSHRWILPLSRAAAAIVFLIPFVFTGYALLTSRVYAPVDHPWETVPLNWMKEQYGLTSSHNGWLSDVSTQMIPWRAAVRWSLAHGEWPLWNRFILSGDILAPSAQPAPYNPFTLLACLLPVAHSMTFTAAIAHFLAALGAFLLARELGCREAAALVAAAGFTYATSMALFILWPLAFAWAWAPWVFLGVCRKSVPLLTCAFVLLLLAGHPETALHVVALSAVWALGTVPPRELPRLAIAGPLALLLCAIVLLPVLEMVPQTIEHQIRTKQFAETPRGVSGKESALRLLASALAVGHPRTNAPLDTAAVGSIVLALALYGALRVRSRVSWTWSALALFCLLAHSEWIPLARALQKLPLFDQALNERFSFGAALALAMLAALGVEEIFRRNGDRVAVLTLVAVLLALGVGNAWLRDPAAAPVWGRYELAAEIGGLAVAALLVAMRAPRFVIAILLLQRFFSDGDFYHTFDARIAYPPIAMLAPLGSQAEPFRITGHGNAFIPGTSALYELEDVRGYQALTFRRYFETYSLWSIHQPVWFNRVDDLTRPFLSFLNVRYAITWDRDPPPPGWREVSRQKGSMLIENLRVLPRAFVPRHVSGANALEGMAKESDFAARAWIDGVPDATNGPGMVVVRNRRLGYDLDVTMENDGWIVASLPAWSGWRATVDGRAVPTRFANHAFLGLRVPRGTHRVELVFLPRSFVWGAWISLLTTLALLTRRIMASRRASSPAT